MRRRRRQAGVTLVFTALLLTGLCGAAALAVDVGMWFTAKTEAQHAADAAALAGAYTFLDPSQAQPAAAESAADTLAAANQILGAAAAASGVAVDLVQQTVTATVAVTAPGFFGKVLGLAGASGSVSATAQAGSPSIRQDLKPVASPLSIVSTATPGDSYQLRCLGANCSGVPSQYGSLAFNTGASAYGCAMAHTLQACGVNPATLACGSTVNTENGQIKPGDTIGIDTGFDNPMDTWYSLGRYDNGGKIVNTSNQLILSPVYDDYTQPLSSGKQALTIVGYATWFVTEADDTGVTGLFVGYGSCTNGNGSGGTSDNNLNLPVRLVTPAGN